jgi:hypothetical protein
MTELQERARRVLALEKKTPPKKPLEEVARLDAAHQKAWHGKNILWTDSAALQAYNQQLAENRERLRKGETVPRSYSREDKERDYSTRAIACEVAMPTLAADTVEHSAPLCDWFIGIMEGVVTREEKAERESFEALAIAWTPSAKIIALRQLLDHARKAKPMPGSRTRPRDQVFWADL